MLQLELHQDDSPQDLIAKNIELPIRIGFPRDSNLIARVLHEESFQIFASPEFLATFGTPDNQQSLEAFPLGSALSNQFVRYCAIET